jgi:hypothetical protein
MPRHHRQSQDHLVFDQLSYIHMPGSKNTVDLVVGFGDLSQALGELQLGVDLDWNLEWTQAALAHELRVSSHRNPQTRLAVVRGPPAQVVLQTLGRTPHLRKAQQLLHAQASPLLQRGTGKVEAVDHPRLRHKARMILCLPFSVKRNSKLFRALGHFLILVAAVAPVSAQVYKWVDERGVTHYGERPPQGGKASEVPNRLGSPLPGGTGPQGAPQDQSPRQAEAAPKDQESRPGPTDDRQKQEAARHQEQCNQQRDLLARIKQTPPSFTVNEKGQRIQSDNSETIARQEKLVAEQCKG